MKATSVKELSSFLTDTMSGVPGEDKMPEGDSFSSIMETAAKNNTASAFANTQTTSARTFELNVQKTGTRTGSEGRSAASVNENGRANGNRADSRKGPDRKETGDRIQETAEKVTKELKEKLGVSDEEIEETLSSLGLTMADLLNPSDLTAVYAALTGEGGAMDVLTDESLYAGLSEILSDLQTLTDDLKAQLGLTDEQLKEYYKIADTLGLSCLFEAHDEEEVKRCLAAGARILGVNNRNLKNFKVDINNSIRLRSLVPKDIIFVSESGIEKPADVKALKENGTDAVLIGEMLMRSSDKPGLIQKMKLA